MNEIAIIQNNQTLSKGRFDPKLAAPFIRKSISAETRSAYTRGIKEFFAYVGGIHPTDVKREDVIAYRDRLQAAGRKASNKHLPKSFSVE